MKVTIAIIEFYFNRFNEEYFDEILPLPSFRVLHSHKDLGRFDYVRRRGRMENPRIGVSDGWDYTFEQFRNILVHEMVHYYLAYTEEDTWVRHGKKFKRLARELNECYGLDIQKTYDTTDYLLLDIPLTAKFKDLIKW